ncbi:helix-turn-helix transcriptional regulator [Candidatus Gracilibacteria bacterium]|nr:helix-turn-helix transcriptional regulator [Candidatus Gracilibacteria bacterium]NJM90628.1 helix-turn-helix transcriptional regulator [Hydrococcus sp. RU_2_2]NJP22488.1 helix-turn-helix transcriptional regulator [Hydrococcus sp. CRU_1_1]
MTITISEQAFLELEDAQETTQYDPCDPLDTIWNIPKQLGQGYYRRIELRSGLELEICNIRQRDRVIVETPETPNELLTFHFHILGQHQDKYTQVGNSEYAIYGSGLFLQYLFDSPQQKALEVVVSIHPETLCSFLGNSIEQLSIELQTLIRPIEQELYTRVAPLAPMMQNVLWQILRCPYQGIAKRMYLEAKALELVSLALQREIEIQKGDRRASQSLKSETIERIYQAKTILLHNLHEPPSLLALAQQVSLSDRTLKRGFHELFGKTVFGYLHDYRLEQARQLLETGEMNVTEVAQAIGFASRSYFATAFKKKFGHNPKDYQQKKRFF